VRLCLNITGTEFISATPTGRLVQRGQESDADIQIRKGSLPGLITVGITRPDVARSKILEEAYQKWQYL
jgi:hypothetical protein